MDTAISWFNVPLDLKATIDGEGCKKMIKIKNFCGKLFG